MGVEDDPGYRTLSVLSLVSLGLGLAAPIYLAAPLLLVIPLLGIALSALALRQIAASDGAMAGRWAAVVGLALCIGSIGAVFSRSFVMETLLSRQARAVATDWLSRLQSGDAESAFRMTNDRQRSSQPPRPDEPEPTEPPPDPLEVFRSQPIVGYLLAHGAHSKIRYVGDVEPGSGTPRQYFLQQQFTVSDDEHGGEPIDLVLGLQRQRIGNEVRWSIANYQSEKLKSAADLEHSHSHAHPHSH